jgi:hypothetical protein
VPIVNTDPTRPTRWPCHNPCEQCCPYYFYIANFRDGHKIKEIQLCTDRGCGQTPSTPLYYCADTTINTRVQDRSSHICMYCNNIEYHDGHYPAYWIEPIDSCPRVQPTGIGADTTLTGDRDSLCIRNCLRLRAPGLSSQLRPGDSLRIHLGLTGQCKIAVDTSDSGDYDPIVPDSFSTKCVWVCLIWDDNLTMCCMIRVRDCECIISDTCHCDPRRCMDTGAIYYPGGGSGTSTHEKDKDKQSLNQGTRSHPTTPNERPVAPDMVLPREFALGPKVTPTKKLKLGESR